MTLPSLDNDCCDCGVSSQATDRLVLLTGAAGRGLERASVWPDCCV